MDQSVLCVFRDIYAFHCYRGSGKTLEDLVKYSLSRILSLISGICVSYNRQKSGIFSTNICEGYRKVDFRKTFRHLKAFLET